MKRLQEKLKTKISALLGDAYDLAGVEWGFALPNERKFGDLSATLAFALAKKAKAKPFLLANDIAARLQGQLDEIEEIRVAGGGFINFFLRRDAFLQAQQRDRDQPLPPRGEKVIVEHTSINPNKSAHIGHLRNSCLGDVLARCCRFLGYEVEVQNYIDDTGIQVADVVWGLLHYWKMDLAAIKEVPDLAAMLWDLYAEVNRLFAGDEALAAQRREVHKKIEDKAAPEYEICLHVAQQVLLDHIRTMERVGIQYDLMARESDVIALDFFKAAAAELTGSGVMLPSADPEKKGCLVIHYEREKIEKIIVRSNDTITYVGKDIAYNLWKFDLLGRDFHYRPFHTYPDGHPVYMTSSAPAPAPPRAFGRGDRVYNVIDVRQSYLQNLIAQVLTQLGHPAAGANFVHFSYEMVALTPACVREMGLQLEAGEESKPYIEVSGRKGRAVKADDLIAMLNEKSLREVQARNSELGADEALKLARAIAVAALRYFMVKFNLNTVIAFDFREALNFEGDSGPYLQYAMVRLNSILRKAAAADLEAAANAGAMSVLPGPEKELYWEMLLHLSLLETQVEYALQNHEISSLAAYAYGLCQKFNHYYHLFPMLAEKDPVLRALRLGLLLLFRNKVAKLLVLLGIDIPERM
ncbi:MAG: arginine--tRNA ligase [Acidobacteria bacterium]|jgi:arginyl-tRNA synthetase|nr:arginine--tRNA ligase [Acidobacteriota bacterium]